MKYFIIKFLIFIILTPVVFFLVYNSLDYIFNNKQGDNALYIWGDSQTYRGLNLDILHNITKKEINSAAQHGAGVYDFLVFTQKVPQKSTVLISISEPALLRRKNRDRNYSPLLYSVLKTLYDNKYTMLELKEIIKKNKIVKPIFSNNSNMFKYSSNVIVNNTDIKGIKSSYENQPEYLIDKANIINIGLSTLIQKKCNVYFIKFPYYSKLDSIRQNSIIKDTLNNIYNDFYKILNINTIDSIYLNQDKQVMYDYTHLNIYGANQVSKFIGERIKNKNSSDTAYVFSLGN